jgi:hypothetical protein
MYPEVFEVIVCSPVEHIGLAGKQLTRISSVGVQVRVAYTAADVHTKVQCPRPREEGAMDGRLTAHTRF